MQPYAFWDTHDKDFSVKFEHLQRQRSALKDDLSGKVASILKQVRDGGDAALLEIARLHDNSKARSIEQLTFGPEQFEEAYQKISPALRAALLSMQSRINVYHRYQIQYSWRQEFNVSVAPTPPSAQGLGRRNSSIYGQKFVPLQRVGIYAPGGTATYPSSLLMCALPARIAGVGDITVVSPIGDDANDDRTRLLLAAAHIVEADRLYALGGAQAVAALAYGTNQIIKVNKIVGPGNVYVAEAKRQLYGLVGIDMIAGPSEVAVVADEQAPPHWVAADLCAQAEHDADACVALFSPAEHLLKQTLTELTKLTDVLPRWKIIRQSLQRNGLFVKTRSIQEAASLADALAPEHIQLMVADPEPLEAQINNAAAIFMGNACPTVLGDYGAGPNHTLPTSPAAAFMSPLGVYDFVKRVGILGVKGDADPDWVNTSMRLAEAEGLEAHILSARLRQTKDEGA